MVGAGHDFERLSTLARLIGSATDDTDATLALASALPLVDGAGPVVVPLLCREADRAVRPPARRRTRPAAGGGRATPGPGHRRCPRRPARRLRRRRQGRRARRAGRARRGAGQPGVRRSGLGPAPLRRPARAPPRDRGRRRLGRPADGRAARRRRDPRGHRRDARRVARTRAPAGRGAGGAGSTSSPSCAATCVAPPPPRRPTAPPPIASCRRGRPRPWPCTSTRAAGAPSSPASGSPSARSATSRSWSTPRGALADCLYLDDAPADALRGRAARWASAWPDIAACR
jgi:hypothetical protein